LRTLATIVENDEYDNGCYGQKHGKSAKNYDFRFVHKLIIREKGTKGIESKGIFTNFGLLLFTQL
jgi:hypothetical protein